MFINAASFLRSPDTGDGSGGGITPGGEGGDGVAKSSGLAEGHISVSRAEYDKLTSEHRNWSDRATKYKTEPGFLDEWAPTASELKSLGYSAREVREIAAQIRADKQRQSQGQNQQGIDQADLDRMFNERLGEYDKKRHIEAHTDAEKREEAALKAAIEGMFEEADPPELRKIITAAARGEYQDLRAAAKYDENHPLRESHRATLGENGIQGIVKGLGEHKQRLRAGFLAKIGQAAQKKASTPAGDKSSGGAPSDESKSNIKDRTRAFAERFVGAAMPEVS